MPEIIQIPVDAAWLDQVAAEIEKAKLDVQYAIAQLRFPSNAGFIKARGRVTLALDKLNKVEQRLGAALVPWLNSER